MWWVLKREDEKWKHYLQITVGVICEALGSFGSTVAQKNTQTNNVPGIKNKQTIYLGSLRATLWPTSGTWPSSSGGESALKTNVIMPILVCIHWKMDQFWDLWTLMISIQWWPPAQGTCRPVSPLHRLAFFPGQSRPPSLNKGHFFSFFWANIPHTPIMTEIYI